MQRHRRRHLLVEWNNVQAQAWQVASSKGTQRIVAHSSRDTGVDPASALRECVYALHGRYLPLISILPGTEAIVRQILLPPQISQDALDAIMEHELERHLPMAPDAFACDYQIVHAGQAQTSILLAAVRCNVLQQHLEVLTRAGLKPSRVLPSTLAFAFSTPPQSGHWCAIQAREHLTDIVLFRNAAIIQARSFDPRKTEPVREIIHTIQNYLKQQDLESLDYGIYLTQHEESPQMLEALPVRHFQLVTDPYPLFAGAPGASLDFRRQHLREARNGHRADLRRRWVQIMPAALTVALLAGFLGLAEVTDEYETRAEAQEQQRLQRQQQRQSLPRLEREIRQLQDQRKTFRWLEEQYPSLAERLLELVESLPETLWLESISTAEEAPSRRKRLERPLATSALIVTGYASEQTEINTFAQDLASASSFDQVTQEASEPKNIRGKRWLRFKLSLRSDVLEEELR